MKTTITIGNKQLELISSGATPIMYRNEFGADFFGDLVRFIKLAQQANELGDENEIAMMELIMTTENAELIYRLAYSYAKNANPHITTMNEWLAEFEEFPVFDVMTDLLTLAMASMTTKKA